MHLMCLNFVKLVEDLYLDRYLYYDKKQSRFLYLVGNNCSENCARFVPNIYRDRLNISWKVLALAKCSVSKHSGVSDSILSVSYFMLNNLLKDADKIQYSRGENCHKSFCG